MTGTTDNNYYRAMSRGQLFAPQIARCSTALLVVIGLAGVAFDFYVSLAVPATTWWLRLPGTFLGLFVFLTCASAVRRRMRDDNRPRN